MKIICLVHLYVPTHNAGAEVMLHQILNRFLLRGHDITVFCGKPSVNEYDGIKIKDINDRKLCYQMVSNCDVVITHLDKTGLAMQLCNFHKKPIVHIIHNDNQLSYHKVTPNLANLIVANSEWIYKTIPRAFKNKIICIPPINISDYKVKTNREAITLINLSENKGAELFYQLAENFPQRKFIGVVGAYAKQIIKQYPNVEIIEHTSDIQSVYARTGILLVPSAYESWGRVAIEGCCSGIPVLAKPTEGLKESLGRNGLFAENLDEFINLINKLDDEDYYSLVSKNMSNRAEEIEIMYEEMVENFCTKVEALYKKNV